MSKAKLTASAPILLVADVLKASEHYRHQLGFTEINLYGDPTNFCIARRDGQTVMLAQAHNASRILPNWKIHPSTSNIYFWVDDIEALYVEMQASGATIDFTLYTTLWGIREFGVQDIDGYDISFGQIIDAG